MAKRIVKIKCPTCKRRLKVAERSLQKTIVCPKCNSTFQVDEQSNTVVMEGRNELLGPPIGNSSRTGSGESDPFQDIEKVIDIRDRGVDDSTPPSSNPATSLRGSAVQGSKKQDVFERKRLMEPSRNERSLVNGGTGLLILSTGVCLLPLVAGNVPGLRGILAMFPLAAIVLAFLGCFMLAYSRRRASIASLILAALPLLFIILMGFGSYYYTKNFLPIFDEASTADPRDDDWQDAVENDAVQGMDGEDKLARNNGDRFTIDRESINNNPASRFVPKPAPKPVAPVANSSASEQPRYREPVQQRAAVAGNRTNTEASESALAQEFNSTINALNNGEKLSLLKKRIESNLYKGHCKYGQAMKPIELTNRFQLSPVVGSSTVYGIAYYSRLPIVGFDIAYRKDRVSDVFHSIVPIEEQAEFKDSIVADEGWRLKGVNVMMSIDGVVGLQGIFTNDNEQKFSDWAGLSPTSKADDDQLIRLESMGELHGVVFYRDKFDVVGVQLIEKLARQ